MLDILRVIQQLRLNTLVWIIQRISCSLMFTWQVQDLITMIVFTLYLAMARQQQNLMKTNVNLGLRNN